jgi:hypothetical protein
MRCVAGQSGLLVLVLFSPPRSCPVSPVRPCVPTRLLLPCYREQNEQAQLLAEVSHKCRAVEESEAWIIGAKAEKCKAALALMRQLAEEPR